MPMPNAKNIMLSPASIDLGLGAGLQQQLEDEETRKKKKLLQQAQSMSLMSPAAQALFPGGGFGM